MYAGLNYEVDVDGAGFTHGCTSYAFSYAGASWDQRCGEGHARSRDS